MLDRADGNPYFLEELLAHVTESDTAFLPDTLRAVLAARVDALDHDERIVLQEASVIGRTFWSAALAQNQPGLAVADALRRLERRHLIFARPVSSIDGGGDEYLFHHALLRDAAYAGLPDTHRVDAHVATARWLEQRPAASDELTELIAFHYASAAEIGPRSVEDREPIRIRAVTGLVAAGASARRRFDIAHAQDLHARALALAATEIERLGIYEELGDDAADGLQGDSARRWYEQALTGARFPATGSADRSRLCRKLASLMTMSPGAFHASPDPVTVEQLVVEGLEHAPDPISRAQLLMIQAVSARLWQGSEPFGQGTEPDPVPIDARIAAVNEALEIGRSNDLPNLIDDATNGLVILHGIASDYATVLELVASAVAHVDRAPSAAAKADALRTAAVHTIHIEARYEKGLELGRRARALSDGAEPHQRMHALYPIIVALYRLGRWDELSAIVDEHAAAYAREPASACQFVRDGPVIGAIVAAHQGDLRRCHTLAQLVPDPNDDPATASAWQSQLATVLGDAAAAIRLSAAKANEGRLYGPQHALALLEAVLEQCAWTDIDTVIDDRACRHRRQPPSHPQHRAGNGPSSRRRGKDRTCR